MEDDGEAAAAAARTTSDGSSSAHSLSTLKYYRQTRLVHRNPGCVSLLLEEGPKETIEPAQQPREQARTLTAPDIPNLCVFLLSSVSLSVQGAATLRKKNSFFVFVLYIYYN